MFIITNPLGAAMTLSPAAWAALAVVISPAATLSCPDFIASSIVDVWLMIFTTTLLKWNRRVVVEIRVRCERIDAARDGLRWQRHVRPRPIGLGAERFGVP